MHDICPNADAQCCISCMTLCKKWWPGNCASCCGSSKSKYSAIQHWALFDLVANSQYATPCLYLVESLHEKLSILFNNHVTGDIIVRRVLSDLYWTPHSACIHLFEESYCFHCVKPILQCAEDVVLKNPVAFTM